MKCPNCGKESFDKFCPSCGEKLFSDISDTMGIEENQIEELSRRETEDSEDVRELSNNNISRVVCDGDKGRSESAEQKGSFAKQCKGEKNSKAQKTKKLLIGIGIIALVCIIVVVVLACRCNHDNCNVLSDYHNATCEEHIITHYQCLDCGKEWDKEEKQFGNHDFVNYIEIKGATCTEKGLGEETCSVCGKKQTVKPDALGHKWEMSNVITEATCATVGEAEYTCSVCYETENREIPLTDHIEGEWVVTKEATETETGEKTLYCAVCNAEIRRETYTATPEEIKQSYINKCSTYTYSEIARNPENYIGKFAKIKGKVIQVMEDGDDYTLRVNITPGKYIWSDTILVSYTKQNTLEDHILEDDIVTMYGMLSGTYTYESVLGADITVPLLLAKYIDIG